MQADNGVFAGNIEEGDRETRDFQADLGGKTGISAIGGSRMGRKAETTVVIAEDELLVRIGIKSSIDWEKNGFRLLGEAQDGDEALKMLRKFIPDILLLDIKMPGRTGLELLRIIQEEGIPTKAVVISGLDDFLSVKNAMQLGAYDYIHKPRMGYGELLQIMLKIQKQKDQQKCQKISQEEAEPETILLRTIADEHTMVADEGWMRKAEEVLRNRSFCLMYASLIGVNEKKKHNKAYKAEVLYKTATNLISEFCASRKQVWFFVSEKKRYLFLLTGGAADLVFLERRAVETAGALGEMIRRFLDVGLEVGISTVCDQPERILELCGEAHTVWEQVFFLDGKIERYKERVLASEYEMCVCNQILENMSASASVENIGLHLKNFAELCLFLKAHFCMNKRQVVYHLQSLMYQITGQNIRLCELWSEALMECESLEELQEYYGTCLTEYCSESGRKYSTNVKNMMEFLQKNYAEEITLSSLSAVFHLNEHYISRIFKEETGENFLTYLNRVRITKAKRLLTETDLKIYEIAEQTGFKSSVNFNFVFNRLEGISPSVFREKHMTAGPRTGSRSS